jgi:hypothetical protein
LLEPVFQNIINRIEEVRNSYKRWPREKAIRSRNWEFIFSEFDGWIVLHCLTLSPGGGYWIYPMLCPKDRIDSLKESLPNFNISLPSAAYCHVTSGDKHWLEPCWGSYEDFKKSDIPLFFHCFSIDSTTEIPKGKKATMNFTNWSLIH